MARGKLSPIERMHRLYAEEEGKVCGDCLAYCDATKSVAQGIKTCAMAPPVPGQHIQPWSADWRACGLFEPREET